MKLTIFAILLFLFNQELSQIDNQVIIKDNTILLERKNDGSRIIINKTVLDNGYLLVENLWLDWVGSNWVNYRKIIYSYNENNNLIEYLWQNWDGSNWVTNGI